METRELGRSGIAVSRVILGCGNFGGVGSAPAFFGQGIPHEEALRIMDAAWELGITTFDTADAYGGGRSETWIGEWLATKGSDVRDAIVDRDEDLQPDGRGRAIAGLSRQRIRRQIETSLERLGLERIPLYMAHALRPRHSASRRRSRRSTSSSAQGKVGAVGASNFTAEQLAEAVEISELEGLTRYEWVQNSFSLLERGDAETVFPVCHEHGLGYEAFGPLAGGWLAGRYRRGEPYPEGSRMTQRPDGYRKYENDAVFDALEAFEREALGRGVSMAGLALAWLLGVPEVTAVVVGPTRAEQLEPVREALSLELTAAEHSASARLVPVIVLSEHDVRELLDMESCIEAMAEVLASLARGELYNPLRSIARPPDADTLLGLMPAYRGAPAPAYALKEIVIVPTNPSRGLDTHMGGVLLHDGETGELVAIMNASPVTEIRTAAVSAVATRALARPDAQRVAILGAGAQARGHVHAMRAVLDDPEIRIWARKLEAAEELAGEVGATVAPSVDAALFGAEVVCTTTGRGRADRREALARARRARQRRRLVLPDDARARHGDRRALVVLHRPPRVVPERGGRLHPRRGGGRDRPRSHQGRARRGARRHASRPRARGRADRVRVARDRGRGSRLGRARRPSRARARRRRRGRLLIPLADIEAARERIAGTVIRTPLVRLQHRRRAGRDLAQAREPAADRLVQAARRRRMPC